MMGSRRKQLLVKASRFSPLPSSPLLISVFLRATGTSVPAAHLLCLTSRLTGVRWMFAVTVSSSSPINLLSPSAPHPLFRVPPLRLCSSPSPACSLTFRSTFICSIFKKKEKKRRRSALAQSIQTDVSDEIFISQNCNLDSPLASLVRPSQVVYY